MIRAACLLIAVSWPWSHKEPERHKQFVDVAKVQEYVAALADIQQHYPWLRKWAEPSLVTVNRLLSGEDIDVDADMDQLKHDLTVLEQMEQNDTI